MALANGMPVAPMNGSAPNVFNDRRGSNPFQPVQSSMARSSSAQLAGFAAIRGGVATHQQYQSTHIFGGDSYLGQGASQPNGALPARLVNGKTYTRDNPDIVALKRQQIAIGERSAL